MFKEKHMRSIVLWAIMAATGLLAGCQINHRQERTSASRPGSDADITPRPVRFPIIATFPDETMFFFPIYDNPPRADLNLRGISCTRLENGKLVVTAQVQNMGADVITNAPAPGRHGVFPRALRSSPPPTGRRESIGATQVAPLRVVVDSFARAQRDAGLRRGRHPDRCRRGPRIASFRTPCATTTS